MTPTFRAVLAAMATSVSVSKPSAARPLDLAVYESEGRQSGYLFLDAATRMLQDDDFQNPGSLALPRGEQLWSTPDGTEEKFCASYHGVKRQLRWPAETAMKRVAARYPAYDPEAGSLLNLELRINREREVRMGLRRWLTNPMPCLRLVLAYPHSPQACRSLCRSTDRLPSISRPAKRSTSVGGSNWISLAASVTMTSSARSCVAIRSARAR